MPQTIDGVGIGANAGALSVPTSGTTFNLTTTLFDNLIVADIYSTVPNAVGHIAQVTGVSSNNTFSWSKKSSVSNHAGPVNSWNSLERWVGKASGPFTQELVTATFDTACDSALGVYAFSGTDLVTPGDVNANSSRSANDTGFSLPTVTGIGTTNPNTIVLMAVGMPNNSPRTAAHLGGNTLGILAGMPNNAGTISTFYYSAAYIASSPLSGGIGDFTPGNPNTWIMLVDAFQAVAGGGGSPVTLTVGSFVCDFGLSALDVFCDKIHVCAAGVIASYADVLSLSLGNKNFGVGNAFGSPTAGSPTGRKVTSQAITNGAITASGTVTQWAAVDSINSRLLAVGSLDGGKAVTNGQGGFTLGAFVIHRP